MLLNNKNRLDVDLNLNNLVYYRMLFLMAALAYPGWYFVLINFDENIKDSLFYRVLLGFLILLGYLYTFSPKCTQKSLLSLFLLFSLLITGQINYFVALNDFSSLYQIVNIVTFACIAASMSSPKTLGFYIVANLVTLAGVSYLYGSTKPSFLMMAIMLTMGCTFWPPLTMRINLLNRLMTTRRDLDLIVSNAAAGIMTLDTSGFITSANSQSQQIFGYSTIKDGTLSVYNLIHPLQKDTIQNIIKDFLAGREALQEFVALSIKADQSPIWTRFRLNPILDRGVSKGCVAVVIDVTHEQEANAIVLAQKNLLETLVTDSNAADFAKNTCKVLYENINISGCFLWAPLHQGRGFEVLGRFPDFEAPTLTESHQNAVVLQLQHSTDIKQDFFQETHQISLKPPAIGGDNRTPEAGLVGLWHTMAKDRDQNIVAYLTLFRRSLDKPSQHDIKIINSCLSLFLLGMDKIKANNLILAQQTQITQSAKMASLGEMAGGIAHEINNPLAIIRGRFEQLQSVIKNPEINRDIALKFCDSGVQMIDRLKKIIQGLRQFSRDGARDPLVPVKIADIVNDTLVFCSEKYKIKGIQLDVPEIPVHITIEGRHTQISQVLLNLLNNSFDAVANLPEKWVRLDVLVFEGTPNRCQLVVTDSGKGISKETADKLFQPFFTTKGIGQGTGLGLSISLGIIKDHGGTLTYDQNSPNTRFVINLPLYHASTKNLVA